MLNLVIALLGTTRGRSRHFIRNEVAGYTPVASKQSEEDKLGPAFERMFERDKEMLRDLGVPITVTTSYDDDDSEQVLYRIKPEDYSVPEIRLNESSMVVLAVAANLWSGAAFSDDAASALRKVASRAGVPWDLAQLNLRANVRTLDTAFEPLWDALRSSNEVVFSYRSSGSEESTARRVQPWGLGSKYGQWYLVGFDTQRQDQRSFRLSRITSQISIDDSSTFDRPQDFTIGSVLNELGTGQALTAEVLVPKDSIHSLRNRPGAKVIANGQSSAVTPSEVETLSIPYREAELMADDLAAVAKTVKVKEPAALRAAVLTRLEKSLEAHLMSQAQSQGTTSAVTFGAKIPLRIKKRKDNRDRLIRLLSMVPFLVANQGVPETELTKEFNISPKELRSDLDMLMVSGLPGYRHGELMDVTSEHGRVFIRDAETLDKPLRLTAAEACALLVGLEAISVLPESVGANSITEAREQLARVAGPDAWLARAVALQLLTGEELGKVQELERLIKEGLPAKIRYVVRERDEVSERTIVAKQLFSVDSQWYVEAWCHTAAAMRNFRVDQLSIIETLAPDDLVLQEVPAVENTPDAWNQRGNLKVNVLTDIATSLRLAHSYGAELYDVKGASEDTRGAVFTIGNEPSLAQLLARLGGDAVVVEPTPMQDAVITWLQEAIAEQLREL